MNVELNRLKWGFAYNNFTNETIAAQNNVSLYNQYVPIADAFVYSDIPARNMVMTEYRFEEKPGGKKRLMFYLYDKEGELFKINPNAFGLDRKTKVMSCFEVKYLDESGRKRVIFVKPIDNVEVLTYHRATVDNVNPVKQCVHAVGDGFDIVIKMDRLHRKVQKGEVLEVAYKKKIKDGRRFFVPIHVR